MIEVSYFYPLWFFWKHHLQPFPQMLPSLRKLGHIRKDNSFPLIPPHPPASLTSDLSTWVMGMSIVSIGDCMVLCFLVISFASGESDAKKIKIFSPLCFFLTISITLVKFSISSKTGSCQLPLSPLVYTEFLLIYRRVF